MAVLNCEIDPCLETFQTACTKVGTEGWWHLMPRLEALANAESGSGSSNSCARRSGVIMRSRMRI